MRVSNAKGRVFKPLTSHTKEFKIGNHCFSANHVVCGDLLDRIELESVCEWDGILNVGCFFGECAQLN